MIFRSIFINDDNYFLLEALLSKCLKKNDLFMMLDLGKEELSSLKEISPNKDVVDEYNKIINTKK